MAWPWALVAVAQVRATHREQAIPGAFSGTLCLLWDRELWGQRREEAGLASQQDRSPPSLVPSSQGILGSCLSGDGLRAAGRRQGIKRSVRTKRARDFHYSLPSDIGEPAAVLRSQTQAGTPEHCGGVLGSRSMRTCVGCVRMLRRRVHVYRWRADLPGVCGRLWTCVGMCYHVSMCVDTSRKVQWASVCRRVQTHARSCSGRAPEPPHLPRLCPSTLGLGNSCHSHRHCPSGALGCPVPGPGFPRG